MVIVLVLFVSERELNLLRTELRRARKAAFAAGTVKNLHTQWKSFLMFCIYFDVTPVPASVETLCLYVQFLGRTFKSVSAIRNYISGVKLMHMLVDAQCPQFTAVELKLALRGVERLKQHRVKQAAPVTPEILLDLFQVLDLSEDQHLVFWCLSLIAFFTMARKSNLVPTSVRAFDKAKQLCRGDIVVSEDCLLVSYKWSKTNQFAKKVLFVPLLSMPESILCPVRAYRAMINRIPAISQAAAFSIVKHGKLVPLLYHQFQCLIRQFISQTGRDGENFSSHSFRRGGATTAFRARVPPELIQVQGDWASDAYKRYLEFELADRAQVATCLACYIKDIEGPRLI